MDTHRTTPVAMFILLMLLSATAGRTSPAQTSSSASATNTSLGSLTDTSKGGPISLSLTTSGGVSLGAYQAGYLYYLTEATKLNPELFDLRILTGSSAGTINAIATAISMGNQLQSVPMASLFYQVWASMNINRLLDVKEAPPLALSSREVLESLALIMEQEWNKGLDTSLDMVIGSTVTRVKSRKVDISGSFSVPRQEEKFVFRIQGRGRGKMPGVTNYVDQSHGIAQPLLPFGQPDSDTADNDFDILKKLMFASSAFPLAFPAQELTYCMTEPQDLSTDAQKKNQFCGDNLERELFVDGSMFDRNPMGLAYRIAQSGLRKTKDGYAWAPIPDGTGQTVPHNFFLLYVDALNESYPSHKPDAPHRPIEALFPAFGSWSQGFVRSSQAKEIYNLFDHHPDVRDRLYLTERNFPTASGLLFNFFGFFDESFRIFDFYLGMQDAHEYLETVLMREAREVSGHRGKPRYPEQTESAQRERSWDPYFCMRSVLAGNARYKDRCQGEDLRDFRILLQISLNRLYDLCAGLPLDEQMTHLHCLNAMHGISPPQVEAMVSGDLEKGWVRREKETSFQYTLRLLEQYQFHFRDLHLRREDAWMAMSRIRELLAGVVDDYARKLPPAESLVIRVLGKPALNFFKYQPPQAIIYAGSGKGAEVGISLAGKYSPARWIRFNLALQLKGLYELLGPMENMIAMTPLLGVEFEKTTLSGPVLQPRFGVRLGYQFTSGDGFFSHPCDNDVFASDNRACSAPVAQAFLSLSFYERIRFQGGVEWFPFFLPPMSRNNKNVWNGFLEICWQWISPF